MRRELTHQRPRLRLPSGPPAPPRPAAASSTSGLKMVSSMLSGLMFWLTFGWTPTFAYSPRTPDRVSETDMQRLLHGVMEQLGIARPRVEYPAHQAMNLVGPQSIEGGAHEGLQHLGPFGNIPNIVAELTGDNIPKDFSEDQGYPDPPNPCPVGKTVGDGCLENTPDTAEFSREFQLHQHLYDPEHDYPGLSKWNKKLLYEKMKGQRRKRRLSDLTEGRWEWLLEPRMDPLWRTLAGKNQRNRMISDCERVLPASFQIFVPKKRRGAYCI